MENIACNSMYYLDIVIFDIKESGNIKFLSKAGFLTAA